MFKKTVLILLLPAIAFAQLIDDDVMPFGAYSRGGANFFTDSLLTYMHETLGINQHTGGEFNTVLVGRFYQKEIYPYPWGSFWGPDQFDIKPQKKYAHSTYFVSQPEDSALYNVKFKLRVDSLDDDGVYCFGSSGPRYMLDILKFLQCNRENSLEPDTAINLQYYPYLQMRVEDCSGGDDVVVGVFEVFWASSLDSCRFYDTLKVGDFTEGRDTLLLLTNEKYLPEDTVHYYTIFDDEASTGGSRMLLRFWTAGNCTVFIDSFLVHCQYGDDLILGLDPQIAEDIVNYVDSVGFQNKVLGWHLKDTQWPGNYRPYAYINRLIRDSTHYNYPVGAVSWLYDGSGNSHSNGYRDFVKITKPQVLWCYLYPIWSGTAYTGFNAGIPDSALQSTLNRRLVVPCDSIRAVLADSIADSTGWWMYTPQYWYNGPPYPDVIEIRREPTAAELRCETYIGMCYYPKGIMFWLLYGGNAPPDPVGLITTDSLTRIGETVRDDINPYIKAIDSTYLELTWETAYAVDPELAFPSGSSGFIDDITACTNPDSSGSDNPDLGWLHVGEYHDDWNDKYFMLVNRACSKDENGNEAPEVTVITELNRSVLGNPTQLYIIDLAHETRLAGGDTGWVAIPETTFTCLYDSSLYFTTVLKAGEGRLFKVAEIEGIPTSYMDYVYQGEFLFSETYTISSSDTLRFKCPSEITFTEDDTMIINGGLITNGCNTGDSLGLVEFAAAVDSTQWKGLLFTGSTAIGDLSYINIEDTYNHSIKISDSARVELQNSEISNSLFGVHIVNSGILDTRGCTFEKGQYGADGIYNESGDSVMVADCDFKNFGTAGIMSLSGFLEVNTCSFDSIDYYGIYADSIETEVNSSEFTNIEDYGIDAIKGNLEVNISTFDGIDDYGIYVEDGKLDIFKCGFENIGIYGIYSHESKLEIDSCQFDYCDRYGIYVDGNVSGDTNLVLITDNQIATTPSGIPDNTQYGIYCDVVERIRISGNTIGEYCQGGIKLYNSDAEVKDNTICNCDYYGIYSYNSDKTITGCDFDTLQYGIYLTSTAAPTVRWCTFDSVGTGIKINGSQRPALGDSANGDSTKWGKNDFEDCYDYYINQNYTSLIPTKAEMNYFGVGIPDRRKFGGNIDYTPWLPEPPRGRGKVVYDIVPLTYQLSANYPNPFNPNTHISFSLAEPGYTTISIYNILGQKITSLVNEYKPAGYYSVIWNGTNRSGKSVSSGIYFYRIESNEFTDTKKMLLLR